MAITGQQVINVGLPNESANSDSLYTAFTKANVNFHTLFACASPYNTFTAGDGVNVVASNNIVTITNTGVLNIIPGTGVTVSGANGNVTISANAGGGGGGGTVTSVAVNPVSNTRLTVTGSPVVSSGNINIDLATTGITPGAYVNPNVSVDAYGRVTSIANGTVAGTVTSVGLTPGAGIQISGGPITSNGNISVTNTGVTRLNAGAGISLSSGNGNVTISATSLGGTVTSVGVTSSSLLVTGSPIVSSGTITVNLPANVNVTTNLLAGNGVFANSGVVQADQVIGNTVSAPNVTGNTVGGINAAFTGALSMNSSETVSSGGTANLQVYATLFSTTGASTLTLPAGTAGLQKTFVMVADGGDMVMTVTNAGWKTSGTGTITFNDIGDCCTLYYINSKWYCIGNNGTVFA
jgi:hypothetical protein